MPTVNDRTFCYLALIDSHTLHTESLFSLLSGNNCSVPDFYSIHALINRFSAVNRRKFILALNHRSSFSCTFTDHSADYSVELYSTDSFGTGWSHILILQKHRDISNTATSTIPAVPIIETLTSIHSIYHLAANSLIDDTPAAAKEHLEHAVNMFDRLITHICSRLFRI